MLEFVPERVNKAVVLNVMQTATASHPPASQTQSALLDAFVGSDFVIGVHNWLIGTQLKYLVFDLQDEKEVPQDFLEELLQLMRRVRIPFLFAGVMERPQAILKSYSYTSKYPIFKTVEDAIAWLAEKNPEALSSPHDGIHFGTPIEMIRSRLNGKPGEEGDDAGGDLDD